MAIERNPLMDDTEMMDKMINKLTDVFNDLVEWCSDNCPYDCSCKDFAGACSIQTVKSVANWGWRVMINEKGNRMKKKR